LIVLYNLILTLGAALLLPFLLPVVTASRKRRKTFFKRIVTAPVQRLTGTFTPEVSRAGPIWVHALSVGEVISAVPLINALAHAYPHRKLVLSATTLTGFRIAKKRFEQDVAAVVYYPYDFIFSVKQAARAVAPSLVVIVESDIWPNFLREMERRAVPVVLTNARLSNRSYRGYRRFRPFAMFLFSKLTRICTQTREDLCRFLKLGIHQDRVVHTGNIKFDQKKRKAAPGKREAFNTLLGRRADMLVFTAGSTHAGEEMILLEAFTRLKPQFPRLRMVLAPRDPLRAASVCRIFRSGGWRAALLGKLLEAGTDNGVDVVVVDTIGDLPILYGLSDITFVGGSLVNEGGHNPLEPASLSKPVLFGPDMTDFSEISEMLVKGGGAFQVTDAGTLARQTASLLKAPRTRSRVGFNALAVFRENSGAVENTLKEIQRILPP